jgi:AraC family transcriptional regulator of adaptative response/methylated-DNA-[protein]-cysteine methyltransferase
MFARPSHVHDNPENNVSRSVKTDAMRATKDAPRSRSRSRPEEPDATADDGDWRWSVLHARDKTADGAFVYAVRTTGVYCRPSCAARPARRENVSFHADGAAARAAGFRPCKRCRPDDQPGDALAVLAVTATARLIDEAVEGEQAAPSLDTLAAKAGFSPFHFHRLFKKTLGLTPKAYERAARSRRAALMLAQTASVTEAIHGAGYSSSSRFYETATARLGMVPRVSRAGGAGEVIRYATATCSLGLVLVAATARGVCAITLGDDADTLIADLASRFRAATLERADRDFTETVSAVIALVEAPGHGHALPLDVRGTAFQERVWQALRAIPPGTTQTYKGIAIAIGDPKAARGVAQACAANPVAVAIPCHRVVRGSGDLAGYRWGIERKATLLAREKEG